MSQQVQELIDKIKKEGIEEARQKARQVMDEAEKKAADIIKAIKGIDGEDTQIIKAAKLQAEQFMAAAREENRRFEASGRAALKQAARDMILDLRKQIEAVLQSVIHSEIKLSLDNSQLARLIETAIVKCIEANKAKSP